MHYMIKINMENKNHNFLIANSISDIFYHLKYVQGLQIIGSCTGDDDIAEQCVTVRYIPELRINLSILLIKS